MAAARRIFLFFIFITHFFAVNCKETPRRQAISIIIGGDPPPAPSPENTECPPPPPPPCPPPPHPPSPIPKQPPLPPKAPSTPPPKAPSPPSPKAPSPPSPNPGPSPRYDGFESKRLQKLFPVIQAFRKKLMNYDPFGITKTWEGKNICHNYIGFKCDIEPKSKQKTVAGVNFNKKSLGGGKTTIGEFLVGMTDLVYFHANSNNFTGSIPSDVSKLEYFYELDLSNNKFTGEFPYQILNANKLLFLDLRFNTFAGIVPPQVFRLTLDLLFINNNNFIQTLPENLGSTTALYLTLANNKFIGGIPRSIGNAANTLVEVLFLNNQLTGCLPYEIGLLKKSTVFDVGMNKLTGPIPHSFQCLKKMELLNLAGNKFYGTVPEAVCALPKLSNFTLSYNYFTQVGPKCRKLIKNGVLNVKMNCILDLPNQRSGGECTDFFSKYDHSCSDDQKSLNHVPCSVGNSDDELESSAIEWNAPAPASAPGPGSYGALSPH